MGIPKVSKSIKMESNIEVLPDEQIITKVTNKMPSNNLLSPIDEIIEKIKLLNFDDLDKIIRISSSLKSRQQKKNYIQLLYEFEQISKSKVEYIYSRDYEKNVAIVVLVIDENIYEAKGKIRKEAKDLVTKLAFEQNEKLQIFLQKYLEKK